MNSTVDKLKLIATLANFQEQKRVALNVLANVSQLINNGWRTGSRPPIEFSRIGVNGCGLRLFAVRWCVSLCVSPRLRFKRLKI
jgi:hypothetical protein